MDMDMEMRAGAVSTCATRHCRSRRAFCRLPLSPTRYQVRALGVPHAFQLWGLLAREDAALVKQRSKAPLPAIASQGS